MVRTLKRLLAFTLMPIVVVLYDLPCYILTGRMDYPLFGRLLEWAERENEEDG